MSKGFRQAKKQTKAQLGNQQNELLKQIVQMTNTVMKMRNEQAILIEMLRYKDVSDTEKLSEGDFVMVDFMGRLLNEDGSLGDVIDGGLGGSFVIRGLGNNTLVPGFEQQLVGKKVGQSVECDITFPEDYNVKELAGKPAKFFVGIISAKSPRSVDNYVDNTYKEYLDLKKKEAEGASKEDSLETGPSTSKS